MKHTLIQIREDLANELIKLKKVGDTYSDVVERLLRGKKGAD